MRWASPLQFCEFVQRYVRTDKDALIIVTGGEGDGKSTVIAQLGVAMDADFPPDLMCQSVEEYLAKAPALPKWRVIAMDEAKVNKRKSMTKTNVALLDDLQISRGRNHIVLLAFPHESLLDRALIETRVFRKIHVPKRGVYMIYRPERREVMNPATKERTLVVEWVLEAVFTFDRNSGAWWAAYLAKKEGGMRGAAAQAASPGGGPAGAAKEGRDLLPGLSAARALLARIRAREGI